MAAILSRGRWAKTHRKGMLSFTMSRSEINYVSKIGPRRRKKKCHFVTKYKIHSHNLFILPGMTDIPICILLYYIKFLIFQTGNLRCERQVIHMYGNLWWHIACKTMCTISHEICRWLYSSLFCSGHDSVLPNGSHDDVIKWKHFPRYWPFSRGIHRSSVNTLTGQWRGALMLSVI